MSFLITSSSSSSCLPLQSTHHHHESRFSLPSSFSPNPITSTRSRTIAFNSLRNRSRISAFFFNPVQYPIVKEAFKEPVAFLGGVFAGILRLDLNEEPLKEWVTRTVEASDIIEEDNNAEGSATENAPLEIAIE